MGHLQIFNLFNVFTVNISKIGPGYQHLFPGKKLMAALTGGKGLIFLTLRRDCFIICVV